MSHQHFDTHYYRDVEQPIPVKTFEPEVWTDLGIEFLKETANDQRPFFLTIQMVRRTIPTLRRRSIWKCTIRKRSRCGPTTTEAPLTSH